jgi:probable phosphoglycerate mutase
LPLRRLAMLRHGETVGNSSLRFHGSADVALSDAGRVQMREAARALREAVFDLVVASPLRRSWEAARIVAGATPVRIEEGLREIDFGRWEGLTDAEIAARDPVLHREWRERAPGFEYPGGELRAEFRGRVMRAFERIDASGADGALVVAHKGVIRTLAERLVGDPLPEGIPGLATAVHLSRGADEVWRLRGQA